MGREAPICLLAKGSLDMSTTRESAYFRVRPHTLELDKGKFLGPGVYPVYIDTVQIAIRGYTIERTGLVRVTITREQFVEALGDEPANSFSSIDWDIGTEFAQGTITRA